METIKLNLDFKGMVAHRGLAKLETENTIRAFKNASTKSHIGIECDVHRSKDHKLVVSHDESLNRLGEIEIRIPLLNYDEIKEIKYRDLNNNLKDDELFAPLLEEFIEICKKSNKIAVIELKESLEAIDVMNVYNLVKDMNYLEHTTFISFFPGYLTKIRSIDKDVKIQFLSQVYNDSVLDICTQFNFSIDIDEAELNKEIIDKFHKNNLEVNCYTVDDAERAKELISYGIDYITTNILE